MHKYTPVGIEGLGLSPILQPPYVNPMHNFLSHTVEGFSSQKQEIYLDPGVKVLTSGKFHNYGTSVG